MMSRGRNVGTWRGMPGDAGRASPTRWRSGFQRLLLALLLPWMCGWALAAPTLTPIAGMDQMVPVDAVAPQRFTVRLADTSGTPLSGARVTFANNWCFGTGYPGECPFNSAFGSFQWPGSDAWVLTDDQGVATSPPYLAGPLPGHLSVYAYVAPGVSPFFFTDAEATAALRVIDFVQVTPEPIAVRDGLWVVASEASGKPGRGFHLEVQNQVMAAVVFAYEADGRSNFHLATAPSANNSGVASLERYRDGTSFGATWRPAVSAGSAGSVAIAFSGPERGTIQLPGEPIRDIQKLVWSGDASPAGSPGTGLWAISDELDGSPGRGFQIEVQGELLVLTVFAYDATGENVFYQSSGRLQDGVFTGELNQYRGGRFLGGPQQNAVLSGSAGTVTIRFSSAQTGEIQFPGEAAKSIRKLSW